MNREVEEAFSLTCRLVLGKPVLGVDNYARWLMRHLGEEERVRSAIGGKSLRIIKQYAFMGQIPKNRIIGHDQMENEARGMKMDIGEGCNMGDIAREFPGIAYFNLDIQNGNNRNNTGTMGLENTTNTHNSQDAFESKNVSYTSYTKCSEFCFGCYRAFYSKFCINCYNCVKSTNCLECDSVLDSSGAYFCHNCENVHDAMFCSNAKNLRYAVGNVVVGREKYMEMKKILLDYVLGELEAKKSVELDIFNIGAL